jgi:glycosyltransferase involved in cell wall biosynthesis
MHWAFEAMKRLSPDDQASYSWTIVANTVDPQLLALMPGNVTVIRDLTDMELANQMRRADVFILPSLIEGFGLVYVESLSQGTPVVYTANTGANDICTDGVHGFRVPVSDLDSLITLLQRQLSDKPLLESLHQNCINVATQFTWPHFRSLVSDFAAQSSASSPALSS